ncbi:MAG: 16S rRNA (cytidine(1402)-2'-O)-methyltransferase [Alicyclobacillaceae bacterium]|uniref:16S rRNA (cytidine(1402)-2'-O)-methyltransferase n=1 Tax=Alicyclobacillus sp. SP_1 TaxID=2942475 RepID=UPI0021587A23|nr:16S rRNA (cytidine(1402)-2'-O)-methyltransferase [Alicyclobacillus sp. SP_1]MCY0887822.1 16S rRNA (cytidine(1402)-2'-O)-methyltransferase [Alicyclobacillaceae bacterium]
MRLQSFSKEGAKLYICSTPIGNLEDVTHRLLRTLAEADVVAAEDTRQTRKLLTRYEIRAKSLISFHEHNATRQVPVLQETWMRGGVVALVTDAGTPCVSDPGDVAIAAAHASNVPVVPIPGASAVLAALIISGLPMKRFAFHGFLSKSTATAMDELRSYEMYDGTVVFYEAPHRLLATLRAIAQVFPGRSMSICKELTKRHETVWRGSSEELLKEFESEDIRGEYAIVLNTADVAPFVDEESRTQVEQEGQARADFALQEVLRMLAGGLSMRDATALAAKQYAMSRKVLYRAALDATHTQTMQDFMSPAQDGDEKSQPE